MSYYDPARMPSGAPERPGSPTVASPVSPGVGVAAAPGPVASVTGGIGRPGPRPRRPGPRHDLRPLRGIRRAARARRRRPDDPRRREPRRHGAFRLGQDDPAARPRRESCDLPGARCSGAAGTSHGCRTASARCCAVRTSASSSSRACCCPSCRRSRTSPCRSCSAGSDGRRRQRELRRSSRRSASRASRGADPASSRAARRSVSPSRGRSWPGPGWSSPTSRPVRSTRRRAPR